MPKININGNNIYYKVKGNPESENTVIFLNGIMASVSSWFYQTTEFEKLGFKILLHDFKGQMMSDKPKGPYALAQHSRDAIELMEKLKIKKAHLVGTSYGGEVAMRMAIDYPEWVESISVINSASELDETLTLFVRGWKEAAKRKNGEKLFWTMVPTLYHNNYIVSNRKALKNKATAMSRVSDEFLEGQLNLYEAFERDVDITAELNKIKCPALVICGEDDILKPRKFSKKIAEQIPNSEYVVIPDSGHVTILEKPNVINSLTIGFIMKNNYSS
ncbi:alpha/beta hydrolase [Proteinivorax tanatarense]|uniref:Alpha/beta hydrolase n=1 Tax=Proteinivorax tanatarense TaxID=1260629 RepID=A0AAU7VKF0_9FIRM